MSPPNDFAALLSRYVTRSAYTPGQLASLCGLPKSTIVNWLTGRVSRTREWQALVQLLAVLHIEEEEASAVLQAAGHPSLPELRRIGNEEERALLGSWPAQEEIARRRSPFQAVADVPFFVGREAIIEEIGASLRRGQWCVVHGLPGVGKTALAARLAYALRPHFRDGILWARLQQSDPMAILSTFARAYGVDVSEYRDLDSRSRIVRDLLADKQALLVLDDAVASAVVEAVLPPSGGPAVLITTRKRNLRVAQYGRRFTLLPFSGKSDASRQLFAHFLGAEEVSAQGEALKALAESVGHLPLALVIAAARLAYEPGWTAYRFLQQLQAEPLETLRYEDQNVQASFRVSYQALDGEERSFFAALGAFGGRDFSVAMAATVAGYSHEAALEGLRTLHALSLVQGDSRARYRLHPLLATYAATEAPHHAAVYRLLAYLVELAQAGQNDEILERELNHFLAALDGTWATATYKLQNRLALALAPFLISRGLYERAERYLSKVAEQSGRGLLRGRSLCYLARIARHQRMYERAEQYLAQARATPTRSPSLWAAVRLEEGVIAACRNQYERASRELTGALPLARCSGDAELLILLLKESGATAVALGQYEAARGHYTVAEAMARNQSKRHVPLLLSCLGGIAIAQHRDYGAARPLYEEALAWVHDRDHVSGTAILLNNLAVTEWATREQEQAQAHLKEGLDLAQRARDLPATSMILANLGRLALADGAWEQAERYLAEAQQVAESAAHAELTALANNSQQNLAAVQDGREGQPEQLRIFFD